MCAWSISWSKLTLSPLNPFQLFSQLSGSGGGARTRIILSLSRFILPLKKHIETELRIHIKLQFNSQSESQFEVSSENV